MLLFWVTLKSPKVLALRLLTLFLKSLKVSFKMRHIETYSHDVLGFTLCPSYLPWENTAHRPRKQKPQEMFYSLKCVKSMPVVSTTCSSVLWTVDFSQSELHLTHLFTPNAKFQSLAHRHRGSRCKRNKRMVMILLVCALIKLLSCKLVSFQSIFCLI